MTNSPPSVSDTLTSFDRLHPEIRRWIWEQKWEELRDVQDRAISAVLGGDGDVLIAAATAAGKTEAAFLPVLTAVADRKERGFSVLYVSPLKALINDQFRRLDQLCERLEIETVRWHGDAPQSAKDRARKIPRGAILITPESIEAMLIRRPGDALKMLGTLDFVVIDELHAFMKGPRGLHLASLLRRLDALTGKRARRVGLSATIGDLKLAAAWINPEQPDTVSIVESASDAPELRLQIRAYSDPVDTDDIDGLEVDGKPIALDYIADHIFKNLRGSNNLVFAGSRRRVEAVADRLRTRSENADVPNEFFPHHGSLSKELREELEARLKKAELPTTGVATTTLELGIDIGSVTSVAQIGAPRSIASLRQRLGRSGRRRGVPAILRIYVRERNLGLDSSPLDHLRLEVVRAVAAVRLMIEKFVEPPVAETAVATVVLHQTLSVITQLGGSRADRLYAMVCGSGPLSAFSRSDYAGLLRAMATPELALIEQAPDGTIMLGEQGERLTAGRDFYAIFATDQEWKLIAGGRTLGTIPISNPVGVGGIVSFAGQRWKITTVDDPAKVLEVARHASGKIPKFDSLANEPVHDRLAVMMRSVLVDGDAPSYLDAQAAEYLFSARETFQQLGLRDASLLADGRNTHVLTWTGTEMNSVLAFALTAAGLDCEVLDIGLTVLETTPDTVAAFLEQIGHASPPIQDIADFVENLRTDKFDELIPEEMLRRLWANAHVAQSSRLAGVARRLIGLST
ncbi:DEAD/DEAH box helicase [Devosia chinhatensis]|uniref:DEAD/DEAH box helicase n=1 Tax=Devosia chinhatensis TaxID=429727 RepID=A0A0F5FKU2_9HYPH|nr:DEAD/DEAH box helicase [Devosia chinhatensis]KKB09471.1 DEAD/DEAH box helicase [Devosia chinhatensis]